MTVPPRAGSSAPAFIDETLPAVARMWEIHFLLMPGFGISAGFKKFCTHRLGLTPLEAFEMMQGAPNMSVESGSALWRLAHGAPATVQDVIASQSADDALSYLRETAEGRAFLTALLPAFRELERLVPPGVPPAAFFLPGEQE